MEIWLLSRHPVYWAYIFSKSSPNGNYQWSCKNSIKLKKFDECFLFQNGKLLIIYVYSTKSGLIVLEIFDEKLHNYCFIESEKEERLFFSGPNHKTKSYNSYILNPHTHTLDKPPNNDVLHDIYPATYEYWKSTCSINDTINIISDYIITIDTNHLSIQRLSQNETWKSYIELKERYYRNTYTYFNKNEIMQFI
ncbi:hypothetical protein F8M41_001949 [Gigaspora margarita]|uniref:Uncharacterized protein n=1 Tax=Gigaspora margarita TaxID=4874 RepID=A0A8H4A8M7_GIGMA|nr:hypothetical protein F8M41_001949 [Gigaspora margarita]